MELKGGMCFPFYFSGKKVVLFILWCSSWLNQNQAQLHYYSAIVYWNSWWELLRTRSLSVFSSGGENPLVPLQLWGWVSDPPRCRGHGGGCVSEPSANAHGTVSCSGKGRELLLALDRLDLRVAPLFTNVYLWSFDKLRSAPADFQQVPYWVL